MRKTVILTLSLILSTLFVNAQNWQTNYEAAIKKAKASNKVVLLNFTGSDWCYWCKKLDKQVFDTKEFKEYASNNLELVKVDFPRDKSKVSAQQAKANDALANKYKIEGYPTVILVDGNGKTLLETGYRKGGPAKYIKHLKSATPNNMGTGKAVEAEWYTDYSKAVAKAKQENKKLLLDFTGSDWCGWCIKLEKEVFNTSDFVAYAKKNLVMVKLDFPRKKQISAEEKAQNSKLAKKYKIEGYPTILILDNNEKTIIRTGYRKGGPKPYIEYIQRAIKLYHSPVVNTPKTPVMEDGWYTDYALAVAKAKQEDKKILIDFTGSDWCGWCIKLDKEVFSQNEFKNYADKNLILFKADFPRKKQISEKLKQQNTSLAKKYSVKGLPTIIILDKNEKLLMRTGYQAGGATAYVKHIHQGTQPKLKTGMVKSTQKVTIKGINRNKNNYLWMTDYNKALTKAKQEQKTLLLDFTGSDWCGWCIRLDREVFNKSAFRKYALENLILVKLDFPRKKKLSEAESTQNNQLARKYGVKGFPTVFLLDPNENIILKTGYVKGGAENYIKHLDKAIKK